MYGYPQPPFLLLVFGLFIGLTCGAAFEAILKQKVNTWSKNRSTQTLDRLDEFPLIFSFFGICVGICLFLAAGLAIFALPFWLSFGISLFLTLFTARLIWSPLANVLIQIEKGGSKALDLDSFEE
ncbi:hypothetical protein IQ249_07345 [Lusitaniella coriacea LEGE 07157]|uniref:Uncharacterized protein n=1 Tax=Lusitaniella coriacea LEGE 07157 TaxID=945747 RepID=A0A8J7J6P7_9CYAN|nr:hypothetical protein [Lusitaniella coriacea]MBE9115705.1 hypothetical protein [Lusitaniella coriacea LEGE 07157]